jgi:nucleotide-binding universal stress UspA family protein
MITSILCPIDGSPHSDKAVTLASDLAQRYGAELCFLHVLMPSLSIDELAHFADHAHLKDIVNEEIERIDTILRSTLGPGAMVYVPSPSPEVVTKIAEVILADARLEAQHKGVSEVETVTESGNPVKAILAVAKKRGADLIVMGNRGLGSLQGLLVGSVSQKVSHLAECSCIAVK